MYLCRRKNRGIFVFFRALFMLFMLTCLPQSAARTGMRATSNRCCFSSAPWTLFLHSDTRLDQYVDYEHPSYVPDALATDAFEALDLEALRLHLGHSPCATPGS